MYAQAYFEYDSKKSFGVTKSHLRLSKKPIRSTYYVKRADFVACHNQSYVRQYDMVQEVKPGGTFLLNTSWTPEELDANLPGKMKRYIARNGIRLFTVDAVEVAQTDLQAEKAEMEETKKELDTTQAEMDDKRKEADKLLQELLSKADDLEALEAEFVEMENDFLKQIATKEQEYSAAKQAEWAAYMATYVPPTTAAAGTNMDKTNTSGGTGGTAVGGGWVRPCSYTSITSPFGSRTSPTAGASSYHQGVDLDTGTGWTVVAAKAGRVVIAGYGSAAGNYVKIDHGDGVSSVYMHLNSYCVSSGQMVSAGQKIGETGATGVATGDHLHFGIAVNGVYVNPCNYVSL